MPVRKSRHHNIPSYPIKKEGIVTILGSDNPERTNPKTPASLRRTLSADMSSKKWLQQNGFFSPMKKISSSEILYISPENQEECVDKTHPGQDDVWRSIQEQNKWDGESQTQKSTQLAVWGSILQSQKSESGFDLPPPYVHPLVKRSASTLNEKSLEICTESLGSETGSDGFSSYPPSEASTDADDHECREKLIQEEASKTMSDPFEDLHVVKYKESPAKAFPPPLASMAGGDGGSVHMQSRRENGRLVLEAVSVPPRNFFQAERRDGRLVLSLVNTPSSDGDMEYSDEEDTEEEEADNGGGDGEEEEVEEEEEEVVVVVEEKIERSEKEVEFVVEEKLSAGIISLRKSGLLMKKFISLRNMNPNFNKMTAAEQVAAAAEEEVAAVPQSLPPRPPPVARLIPTPQPPAAASFNAYEYFWRNKAAASAVGGGGSLVKNPQLASMKNTTVKAYENQDHQQDLVLIKGNKAEYFVPYVRGCKEPKRSLLIWEPYCIATS